MKRLIITSTDSGAGGIKASRIAARVLALGHSLVHGPAPLTSTPVEYFSARAALVDPRCEDWEREVNCDRVALVWKEIEECGREFDQLELWADPNCNAQLQLVQLLDWVRSVPEIARKLRLVHFDCNVGELSPESIASLSPTILEAGDSVFETATRAWRAYRQPTPEAWFALVDQPLSTLPHLPKTVVRLLEELPAQDSALGRTQTELLCLIETGDSRPPRVFGRHIGGDPPPVFAYWELGRMLNELAFCEAPLILGLMEHPFDLALHEERTRFERYRESVLSLSALGRRILAGDDDFSRHNVVDRWWGGTKLTNDRLWRWDDANRSLVEPT